MKWFPLLAAAIFIAAALPVYSQPSAPQFEVASIKPSPLHNQEHVDVGLHIDGSQVHIASLSLRDYIRIAYRVKDYQVTGPDWLSSARFDIDAKLPAGGTRAQVPEMLQALLAERFGLKAHRDSKEMAVYGLVVGSGGPKMKESPPVPDTASAPDAPADAVNVNVSGGRGGVNFSFGKGSSFVFADNRLEGKRLTMVSFADTLARFTDRPVVDATGLTAPYDFALDLSPEDYYGMLVRSAVNAGVTLSPQAMRLLDRSDGSLSAALARLGLKLDPRKAPIDVVVVDSIRKSATEN